LGVIGLGGWLLNQSRGRPGSGELVELSRGDRGTGDIEDMRVEVEVEYLTMMVNMAARDEKGGLITIVSAQGGKIISNDGGRCN